MVIFVAVSHFNHRFLISSLWRPQRLTSEQLRSVPLTRHKGSLEPAKWRDHAIKRTRPIITFKVVLFVHRGQRRRRQTKTHLDVTDLAQKKKTRPDSPIWFEKDFFWLDVISRGQNWHKMLMFVHYLWRMSRCWSATRLPTCVSASHCHRCGLSSPLPPSTRIGRLTVRKLHWNCGPHRLNIRDDEGSKPDLCWIFEPLGAKL